MGIFRNFPYSNFHDLNLDDIIKNIRVLNTDFEALENKFDKLITETHNYIKDYLDNIHFPTKTSELINDSGFITSASIPTKTSELVNDSGFITNANVPTKTSELVNDSGFIDGKPDVIGVANRVPEVISGESFNGGYYIMGNTVIIQISGTVTGTFPANDYWTIASGLPTSLVPIALNVTSEDNVNCGAEAIKHSNGILVLKSGSVALTGKTITVNGIYIKN